MSRTNKETVLSYQDTLSTQEPETLSLSSWIKILESRQEVYWSEAKEAEISGRGYGYDAGKALVFYRFLRYFRIGIRRETFEKALDESLETEIEATDKEVGTSWHFGKAMALCQLQHELKGVVDLF